MSPKCFPESVLNAYHISNPHLHLWARYDWCHFTAQSLKLGKVKNCNLPISTCSKFSITSHSLSPHSNSEYLITLANLGVATNSPSGETFPNIQTESPDSSRFWISIVLYRGSEAITTILSLHLYGDFVLHCFRRVSKGVHRDSNLPTGLPSHPSTNALDAWPCK